MSEIVVAIKVTIRLSIPGLFYWQSQAITVFYGLSLISVHRPRIFVILALRLTVS